MKEGTGLSLDQLLSNIQCFDWFHNSPEEVQRKLLSLDESCMGFLVHLVTRKNQVAQVEIISLDQLYYSPHRIFGFYLVFKVRNLESGSEYFYEYHVWKTGENSGVKGPVLVRRDGVITHICILRGDSFAFGASTFDCPGGFSTEAFSSQTDLFMKEIKEETGIQDFSFELIYLGYLRVDRGLTANRPALMAAIIDVPLSYEFSYHCNDDPLEMTASQLFIPVEDLWGEGGLIERNDDSFFHACVLRLLNRGILSKD